MNLKGYNFLSQNKIYIFELNYKTSNNETIVKVGYTTSLKKRQKDYNIDDFNYSYLINNKYNIKEVERCIQNNLKSKYQIYKGNEYYIGDLNYINDYVKEIIYSINNEHH